MPTGGDSSFGAAGWEKTMDLLANLPPSNDSLKGDMNTLSATPWRHGEVSCLSLCIFWLFGGCLHPQMCFKLNSSSPTNLSARADFLAWFSLVSLDQHQPLDKFPAVWQCCSSCHLPSLLLFLTLLLPKPQCSPLQMCGCAVRIFLPSFKPLFYCHTVSQGGSE